ncbi:MAG TPA: branched-chain amino acid ABC transporter permease [Thermoanaerobaculia bacterium]|nr:branched-chain amino acid ABC transporter permease [Thermoanaerobaculia bacterium]
MIYREVGELHASYVDDSRVFPIQQDRIFIWALLAVAFVGVPLVGTDYWYSAIFIPFLILSLAALGLNILTGYAGQLSLGTAAFMAVGAFAAFNFAVRLPKIPVLVDFVLAGLVAAGVGLVFGLPSLRIKGFYLAVATLAAQFFIEWLLTKVSWFSNDNPSGVINAPRIVILGLAFDRPARRYLLTLAIVVLLAAAAKNMVRSQVGRAWMAVRDMDIAAEVVGIPMLKTKLLAFGVSSFYCGVAGALWAFLYLGSVEPQAFDLSRSFQILFMIIVGGMGSVLGSFLGAAFIVLLPIFLNVAAQKFLPHAGSSLASNLEIIVFGGLILFFLAVEPHGLARLWQTGKEKLRLWPFPH